MGFCTGFTGRTFLTFQLRCASRWVKSQIASRFLLIRNQWLAWWSVNYGILIPPHVSHTQPWKKAKFRGFFSPFFSPGESPAWGSFRWICPSDKHDISDLRGHKELWFAFDEIWGRGVLMHLVCFGVSHWLDYTKEAVKKCNPEKAIIALPPVPCDETEGRGFHLQTV